MPIQATECLCVGAPFGDRKDPKLDGVRALKPGDRVLCVAKNKDDKKYFAFTEVGTVIRITLKGWAQVHYASRGITKAFPIRNLSLQSANAVNSQTVESSEGSAKA